MIASFRDDWLRAFFVDDVRSQRISADLETRLFRKLQMIDDATNDQDLRVPPSNHFEKLKGKLEGLHSIRLWCAEPTEPISDYVASSADAL